jgi:hypothetical protein
MPPKDIRASRVELPWHEGTPLELIKRIVKNRAKHAREWDDRTRTPYLKEVRMKKRLFIDADVRPTEALLRKKLGSAMDFYTSVLGSSGGYRKEWQYSRGNGWILKVDDMRKALYYLIAFEDGIEISLTVRDSEREGFLNSFEVSTLHPQIRAATKYSEGWALRFEVESAAECKSVLVFLKELMKIRSPKKAEQTHKGDVSGTKKSGSKK